MILLLLQYTKKHILKHCNKIIELLTNESKPMQTEDINTINIKKNIEKQPRFFTKNKKINLNFINCRRVKVI